MNNPQIYDHLVEKIQEDRILLNEPMKKHTSFKIGGNADIFVKAKSIDEIRFILELCKNQSIPLTIIGNGSNILVKDGGISGIVLKIEIDKIEIYKIGIEKVGKNSFSFSEGIKEDGREDEGIEVARTKKKEIEKAEVENKEAEGEKNVLVTVGAGVTLGKLAQVLLKKCIAGFEFASGIPGTIGGAIKMNAGAYGSELKDIVYETVCIDTDGNIVKLNNKQQDFSYRNSVFKTKKYIILESKLLLRSVEENSSIREKMNEYKRSRLDKQPLEFPSAGSTFKRGEDYITAKLIDDCGLKGYSIGGAQISTKHAGFIINKGDATAEDVLALIDFTKKKVLEKFGKNIELEVEVLGE